MSHSSAIKWSRRKRETGTVAASPMGGRRPRLLVDYRDWLLSRRATKPDLTVQALLDELRQQHGVQVCLDTLWRFLKAEGLSFKKSRSRIRTGQACYRQTAVLVGKVPDPD